ncbi:MAG TPA: tRNA pseudouridine(38-40) synthase TruA [Jatrophihabitantaceae bacterium]|jgi:tRNA pseudouridine38-40 synthase|nr:tRNA pseudouridine(38-40) synthase TruA [Jatrophihabitantaceae bacterium]
MSDADNDVSRGADPSLDAFVQRVRLDLSYDGTDFSGWAVQPGRRTVQADVQAALATALRLAQVALTVAGRTDAGVHATGQVAHADLPVAAWRDAGTRLVRSVNGLLAADVRVRAITVAPSGFDARFSALWRRYEYRICDRPTGVTPLRRRLVLNWPRPLDEAAMAEAARQLLGLHDFAAFCRFRKGSTSVRTMQRLDVERIDDEIVCTVQADAFCHSMVRSLVGALIAVGDGRRMPNWPAALLEHDRRADDVTVAAPHGLTLVGVGYPPDSELADRAQRTRAVRAPLSRP